MMKLSPDTFQVDSKLRLTVSGGSEPIEGIVTGIDQIAGNLLLILKNETSGEETTVQVGQITSFSKLT